MLHTYTVSFFGERKTEDFDLTKSQAEEVFERLIKEKQPFKLLIGRENRLDGAVSDLIVNAKHKNGAKIEHICVLPFANQAYIYNMPAYHFFYDDVEIFRDDVIAKIKRDTRRRNKSMVDRSDLCVFYINSKKCSAYKAFKYALKKGKKVINLADPSFSAETLDII